MTIAHPFALITICSTPRSTWVRNGQRDVRNQRSSTVPGWIIGEILRLANGVRTVRFKTTNKMKDTLGWKTVTFSDSPYLFKIVIQFRMVMLNRFFLLFGAL